MICDECETVAHCLKNGCVPKHQALDRMAENARELGLDYEPVWCGNCNGSGRMVRDPDIGTDQECFVCDGAGVPSAPTVQQSRSDVEPVAWVVEDEHGERLEWAGDAHSCHGLPTLPLYTTPPAAQRQWVEVEQIKWDGDKLIAKLKENT